MLMSWAAASLRTGAVAAGRAGAARQPERPPGPRLPLPSLPQARPPPPGTGPRPSAEDAGCPLRAAPGSPCARGPRAAAAGSAERARVVLKGQLPGAGGARSQPADPSPGPPRLQPPGPAHSPPAAAPCPQPPGPTPARALPPPCPQPPPPRDQPGWLMVPEAAGRAEAPAAAGPTGMPRG